MMGLKLMPNHRRLISVMPAILCYGLITYLSHQPSNFFPCQWMPWDKFTHFCVYFIFGITLLIPFIHQGERIRRYFIMLCVGGVLAGIDEWHQGFIPGRYMDLLDWISDILGLLFSMSLGYLYGFFYLRK